MHRLLPVRSVLRAAAVVVSLVAVLGASVAAGASTAAAGNDISYPQCGGSYPSGQAFGVVGVNGGRANTANPCLASELSWGAASPGLASPAQPPVSFYLNTADPGPRVADWPTSGSTPQYGTCDGSWSTACAYLYGEARSSYSFGLATNAASQDAAAGLPSTNPASDPWWLDIETANTWATSSDSASWSSLNVAAIQGFVGGLQGQGVTTAIGFYSTAFQWNQITGLTASTSPAFFPSAEPNWVAGAGSRRQAKRKCTKTFTGAPVQLTQYPSGGFDADYRCA